jgi:hypothetical protein
LVEHVSELVAAFNGARKFHLNKHLQRVMLGDRRLNSRRREGYHEWPIHRDFKVRSGRSANGPFLEVSPVPVSRVNLQPQVTVDFFRLRLGDIPKLL